MVRCLASMGFVLAGGTAAIVASVAAVAQNPPVSPNQRDVYLVRQDFSDCTNSNVPTTRGPNVAGTASVIRGSDGNTTVKVALNGTPNTTYEFFLKCVKRIGKITTGNDGAAQATFSFPTDDAGDVYAFDSYPEGAPAGNKLQSVQVNFK